MAKSYEELLADMTGIIAKVYEKGYDKGYERGKFDQRMETAFEEFKRVASENVGTTTKLRKHVKQSKQEARDRIVERAKADIDSLKGRRRGARYGSIDDLYHISDGSHSGSIALRAKFVINKHKRTVVVILYGAFSNKVRARGIAKCAPSDCFNVHIGKSIALHRALGLEVPDEYLNAPQPTEVRVGDKIRMKYYNPVGERPDSYYVRIINGFVGNKVRYEGGGFDFRKNVNKDAKIIDDSRDGEDG